jgi:hypothetical protein
LEIHITLHLNSDGIAKIRKTANDVIPAKAGIQ